MRTYEAQQRFAGRKMLLGFYFAKSEKAALSGLLFYKKDYKQYTVPPPDFLDQMREKINDKILLRVELDIANICDFTQPWIVQNFLVNGHFKAKLNYEPTLVLRWLNYILAEDIGGNEYTNGLGCDCLEAGFLGVKFPSVRMMLSGNRIDNGEKYFYERTTINTTESWFGKGAEETGQAQIFEQQLQEEHCLVYFNGGELTTSTLNYSWTEG